MTNTSSTLLINPVVIEIRPSRMLTGQIGMFAARDIKKNTIIAEAAKLGEKFIPWKSIKKIDVTTREKIKHYCLDTEEGFFIPDDFNYLSVPWNMNHSCLYNVGFDESGNFVTTKTVKRDEELVWDYGMGRSNPKFKLVCMCGNKCCRKLITGTDWKNPRFVKKNKKYFLRELLQKTNR
jgi:hypothetical protein